MPHRLLDISTAINIFFIQTIYYTTNTSLTWTIFVLRRLTLPRSTPTSLTMTLFMLSLRAANCFTCLFFIGIICLTLMTLLTNAIFFAAGNSTYQQIKGVAMGSYHSRQIADLVFLLSEFLFLTRLIAWLIF